MSTKRQKILAIIPARGGSKSIPRKNIVPVGGKPLIAWTIEAALAAQSIDRVIVSSDSDEILRVAEEYGAEPLRRPAHLATDTARPEPLVRHILQAIEKKDGYRPNLICYLQPTSPLRDAQDIEAAIKLMVWKKAASAISFYEIDNKSLKAFVENKHGLVEPLGRDFPSMNRQQLPRLYMQNGAIYIFLYKSFLASRKFHSTPIVPYVMPKERSIDIDTMNDIKDIEKVLASK